MTVGEAGVAQEGVDDGQPASAAGIGLVT